MTKKNIVKRTVPSPRAKTPAYPELLGRISGLLDEARRATVRVTNALLTPAYWEIGQQIVEFEQKGETRAEYGEQLLRQLGKDLSAKHGRGFSQRNLQSMRLFYLGWEIFQAPSGKFEARVKALSPKGIEKSSKEPSAEIWQTASAKSGESIWQTVSAKLQPIAPEQLPLIQATSAPGLFPLPWSHYVRLMSVKDDFLY